MEYGEECKRFDVEMEHIINVIRDCPEAIRTSKTEVDLMCDIFYTPNHKAAWKIG